jgi:hypothetical protein
MKIAVGFRFPALRNLFLGISFVLLADHEFDSAFLTFCIFCVFFCPSAGLIPVSFLDSHT